MIYEKGRRQTHRLVMSSGFLILSPTRSGEPRSWRARHSGQYLGCDRVDLPFVGTGLAAEGADGGVFSCEAAGRCPQLHLVGLLLPSLALGTLFVREGEIEEVPMPSPGALGIARRY